MSAPSGRILHNSTRRRAGELAARLIDAGNSLDVFPHRGRPVPGTSMRELLGVSPYIIRYRIVRDEIVILRVRHGARHPAKA